MSLQKHAGKKQKGTDNFSNAQRAELGARRTDQDRTLAAMHALEEALGAR